MKRLLFTLMIIIGFAMYSSAWVVSGTAVDAETGAPLPDIEITLLVETGLVRWTYTATDGSFSFDNIPDGDHGMEFHYYEPVVINGTYYLRSVYDDTITVSGGDVSGIVFEIEPHYPVYHVSGTLYNSVTLEPIQNQQINLRLDFTSHSGFFFALSDSAGNYSFSDSVPDWTYTFNVFDNDYYYGDAMELVIDTTGPQEIGVDFYLEPKSGVKVSGKLYDIETNEPILLANRTVRITAINSYFAQTDSTGEFTFVNVTPGYYANITVTTEDTSYINGAGSTITDFTVPEGGTTGVGLFQQKFVTVHEMNVDDNTYEPGEMKTFRFSLVYDNDVYSEIWGIELHLPPEMVAGNITPFINYRTGQTTFERDLDCSTDERLVWEGYHSVFGSGNQGNLSALGDTVYADVELSIDTAAALDAEVFYHVFYSYACTGGPFSYGTIKFNPVDPFGIDENAVRVNGIRSYPNPANEKVFVQISLEESRKGKISIYDMTGHLVSEIPARDYPEGQTEVLLRTSGFPEGLYFYSFSSGNLNLTGKLIVARR